MGCSELDGLTKEFLTTLWFPPHFSCSKNIYWIELVDFDLLKMQKKSLSVSNRYSMHFIFSHLSLGFTCCCP